MYLRKGKGKKQAYESIWENMIGFIKKENQWESKESK